MRFAHVSEIIFDPSIFDIFVCWFNCGTVVPMNKKEYKVDIIKFLKKIEILIFVLLFQVF